MINVPKRTAFQGFGMGAVKDPDDQRDFPMLALLSEPAAPLPEFVLHPKPTPIRHQQLRGACVAFEVCAIKEFQEKRQRPRLRTALDLSEEFIYSQIRLPGGGAYMRSGMAALATGVTKEQFMPYGTTSDDEPLTFAPTRQALRSARAYRAQGYARLNSIDEICRAIVHSPVGAGVGWRDGWFYPERTESRFNIKRLEPNAGVFVGGHAIPLFGYDYPQRVFYFPNSWGTEWASAGWAAIPFESVEAGWLDVWATFDEQSKHINREALQALKNCAVK